MDHPGHTDIERSWDPGWDPDTGRAWRVVTTASGVRFVLPGRSVPWQRAIGLGIAALGFVPPLLAGLMTSMFWWSPVWSLIRGQTPHAGHGWFGLIGLLFPLLAMRLTAKALRFGLLVAFGHSEVEIGERRVIGWERWGPVRRRTPVKRDTIRRVVIEPGLGAREGRPSNGFGKDLANLVVHREHDDENKRKVGLAYAYHIDLIDALAHEVAARLGLEVATEAPDPAAERGGRSPDETPGERVSRPSNASGTLTETEDGISISLPALGYIKGTKGFGVFAIVWMAFISVFSVVFVGVFARPRFGGAEVFALLMLSVFWAAGLGMVFFAVRSGRRRGMIDVVGRDLLITRQSVGKPVAENWASDEIDRVVVGPSGTEINEKPVLELQVWLKDGVKRGFFPERRDDELRWIAGEITAALRAGGGG